MPAETKRATHVYIQVGHPTNLGIKWEGPFPIVDRPSETTLTVRVGYTVRGLPRLEVHHWNRVHIAHLRPEVEDANKRVLGRRRQNHTEEIPPNLKETPFTVYDSEVSQPFW